MVWLHYAALEPSIANNPAVRLKKNNLSTLEKLLNNPTYFQKLWNKCF